MSELNESSVHLPLNGGGVTFKVVGHSGENAILGPCLEIRTQANGSTLNFQSLHVDIDTIEALGSYLMSEASRFRVMEADSSLVKHPLHMTATLPYHDDTNGDSYE